jgi:hypothetical protein
MTTTMIHNNIPKPILDASFNLDDIHKIREWNYERTKDATAEERLNDFHKRGEEAQARFDAWKVRMQGQS